MKNFLLYHHPKSRTPEFIIERKKIREFISVIVDDSVNQKKGIVLLDFSAREILLEDLFVLRKLLLSPQVQPKSLKLILHSSNLRDECLIYIYKYIIPNLTITTALDIQANPKLTPEAVYKFILELSHYSESESFTLKLGDNKELVAKKLIEAIAELINSEQGPRRIEIDLSGMCLDCQLLDHLAKKITCTGNSRKINLVLHRNGLRDVDVNNLILKMSEMHCQELVLDLSFNGLTNITVGLIRRLLLESRFIPGSFNVLLAGNNINPDEIIRLNELAYKAEFLHIHLATRESFLSNVGSIPDDITLLIANKGRPIKGKITIPSQLIQSKLATLKTKK